MGRLEETINSNFLKMGDREEGKEVVCVTGASGYIGSWLVCFLLQRSYTVHATVQNINDEKETKHLEALEGDESRLHLFQINLLDYDSIVEAIRGTTGVFHLASPCIVHRVDDPEKMIVEPAVKGTINVLTAAKELGIRRVVVTSSISAIMPNPSWPADRVMNEECWTDIDFCRKNEIWYAVSKTLAEKAAWEFAKEKDLDVVVINPGTAMGPMLPPVINASMGQLHHLLQGSTYDAKDFHLGVVHVKDVARAHILVYENTSATGRHLCVEAITRFCDHTAKLAELYPEYNVHRFPDTQPEQMRDKNASRKLMELGLEFIPEEQIIRDGVESLKSRGFI